MDNVNATPGGNTPPTAAPASTKQRPLKVTIISHSDKLGGAAVVTYRLMRALRALGIEARMVVFTRHTFDPHVTKVSSRFARSMRFLWERVRIYLSNGFDRDKVFQVSVANTGSDLSRHPWVRDADVLMLGWTNQGLLSLKGLRRLGLLGKPMVQVMHDMWCITGICHHSRGCERFEGECGRCPFLNSDNPNDLSHKTWLRKKRIYDELPITFVAVSSWLENQCRRSSLLRDRTVLTIPNAFPAESYYTRPKALRQRLPIDYTRKIILMGAARLDDPIKDLPTAIAALNLIFDNEPRVANEAMIVFFGAVKNPAAFDDLRFPYIHIGSINDEVVLRELYASAAVVLSTSLYETLPGTLIEGQAAGCVPVTTGSGGQRDIVEHLVNGYITPDHTPAEVAKGIIWALDNVPDRNKLHRGVESRFDAPVVAQRYADLFHTILAGGDPRGL